MMANFEESRVLVGGNVVVIEKGQMILSQQNISEKWNISRQTLRTFLNHLEKDGMISRYFVQKTNHKITILTICNYSKYQDSSTTNQPLINHRATTEQPQSNQIKECKELKEGKEKDISTNVDIRTKPKKQSVEKLLLLDYGIDEQLANDFLILRKSKRAPVTKTVCKQLQDESIKAGITVNQAVEICISRTWQNFNASWDWGGEKKVNGKHYKTKDEMMQENTAKAKEAFLARFKTIEGEVVK